MSSSNVFNEILEILKKAIASALSVSNAEYLSIKVIEFSKSDKEYNVIGTFEYAPFFTSRSGNVFATLATQENKLEITSLKIDEKEM